MSQSNVFWFGRAAGATLVVCVALVSAGQAGLIAWWSFDDPDNLGFDAVGTNNGGAVTGVTYATSGQFGGAANFGTQDDNYSIALTNLGDFDANGTVDSGYTISSWLQTADRTVTSAVSQIFHISGSSARPGLVQGINNSDGVMSGFIRDAGGTTIDRRGTTDLYSSTEWHHLINVYDINARTMKVYVDGELEGTATNSAIAAAFSGFTGGYLGRHAVDYPTTRYGGLLDDLGVWKSALTEGEARAIYTLGLQLDQNDSTFGFNYDLGAVTELFDAYHAQGSVTVDNEYWWHTDGLNALAPEGLRVGELWEQNGRTYLLLDAGGTGTGMMIPEPGTWLLLFSALACALLVRSRHGKE